MSIGSILTALAAIPKILGYVESFASAVTLWFLNRQKGATLGLLADAAALHARAESDDDRYKVAQAYQVALARPRVTRE